MEIGVDSFAAILPDPTTGRLPSATDRMADLIEEVEAADRAGLDVMVVAKMLRADQVLGGVSRITLQMSTASLEPAAMRRSIELLGAEVAPIIRVTRTKNEAVS